MSTVFSQAFSRLNTEQQRAVTTIDGPVMVIAGPGTGKTQVLTLRIAQILQQTDTAPRSILALTFTESAAHNMRQRLLGFIGEAAYQVRIETFHAFCDEVIRSHPEYFPLKVNSQPLSDIEKFQVIEELLQTMALSALRTVGSAFHYLHPLLKAISDLKREGVSPAQYAELVEAERSLFEQEAASLKKTALTKRQKALAKMEELGQVYSSYQAALIDRRRYDFDDMIRFVLEAFQMHDELLAEYQEKFLYFLVDEYQDTNTAQNTIVDLLASFWGEDANVCVVGDPHQSIYRFQGASLENTLGFLERYPSAQLISLEVGYRSPQDIYTAASAVISHNSSLSDALPSSKLPKEKVLELEHKLQRPLAAANETGAEKPIMIWTAPTVQDESLHLIHQLQKLLADGVSPEQIAVLYRTNADGAELQELCLKYELPIQLDHTQNILDAPFTQQVLLLIQVITALRSGDESGDLAELLFAPWWNIPRLTLLAVVRAAGKSHLSVYERIQAGQVELSKLQDTKDLTPLDLVEIEDVLDRLGRWGVEEEQQPLVTWLERLLTEAGVITWVLKQPDKLSLLSQLQALVSFVKQLCQTRSQLSAVDFLDTLTTMSSHNLAIMNAPLAGQQHGITFSTVHKAKGQEWEYVFLVRCVDGKWGNGRASRSLPLPSGILRFDKETEDDDGKLDDDRRLFYVALTRAKTQFTVSYAESIQSGQSFKPTLGSIFLDEIPSELKSEQPVDHSPEELEHFLIKTLAPTPTTHWTEQEKQWLAGVTADFPLSVSALNTYLRSPEEFLQSYLLKIPRPQSTHQAFGTAIHSAMEFIYQTWRDTHIVPSFTEVMERYHFMLSQQYLDKREFERRLEHGRSVLQHYLETQPISETQPLLIEKFFGYGATTTMLGDIRLTGQVDRVDWVDESLKTVQVIDYKTGRSRTINEIDGKVSIAEYSERELALPEEIRGWYKRQLLFYKLLLQLDKSFPGTVVNGTFEYVEPEESGKYVRRQFELADHDIELLKKLIVEVMTEIRQLKFISTMES